MIKSPTTVKQIFHITRCSLIEPKHVGFYNLKLFSVKFEIKFIQEDLAGEKVKHAQTLQEQGWASFFGNDSSFTGTNGIERNFFLKVGTSPVQRLGVFFGIIVFFFTGTNGTEQNERFQKGRNMPAQGLGVVPWERSIFLGNERNETEQTI